MLNRVAKSVIEAQRGKHQTRVFTYRGRPVGNIYNSGWKRARKAAQSIRQKNRGTGGLGLCATCGFTTSSTHSAGDLRAAGVPLETRKVLLGHRNGDITSHYSAPEIEELLEAANRVCAVQSRKSHAMTLLKRKTA